MNFDVQKLVEAVEVLDRCPKVNAIGASLIIRISKKRGSNRLVLRTAADLQAVARIMTFDKGGEIGPLYIDRPLFSQWVKGLRKKEGTALLKVVKDNLIVTHKRRSGKFPLLVSVGGYEDWDKAEKSETVEFEPQDFDRFRLAGRYLQSSG